MIEIQVKEFRSEGLEGLEVEKQIQSARQTELDTKMNPKRSEYISSANDGDKGQYD